MSPLFRYSLDKYTCDKNTNIIYKGTSSIKGLSKTVGEKLYTLKDKQYSNFLDLLKDCKELGVGNADLTTLAKLNYFEEFGKIKKILKCLELYEELYGKKILKKDKIYGAKLLYLKKFCDKETDKQYSGFHYEECLRDLFDKVPNEDINIKQKASYQLQYFGYIDIIDSEVNSDLWIVMEIKDRAKNKIIDLYRIFNGQKMQVKIKNTIFEQKPFNIGSMLMFNTVDRQGKWSYNSETNELIFS